MLGVVSSGRSNESSYGCDPYGYGQRKFESLYNFRVTDVYKSQLPLSRYHTISPLSQHHRYRNITTITISPLSRHHHYHNITTITRSPLSKHHNITTITISPQSQHNITSITISPLSQDHHYQNITTITI